MLACLIVLSVLPGLVIAHPRCGSFKDCNGCVKSCRWCPRDNSCRDPAFVNLVDPCWIHGDDIKKEKKCDGPEPSDTPDDESWNHCAYEGGSDNVCQCNGQARFGKDTSWSKPKVVSGSITCEASNFGGSPSPDVTMECQCLQAPNPTTPPTNNAFAKEVLEFVLKKMGIKDVNLDTCISDVGNSRLRFQDFAVDLKSEKYSSAFQELGRGISALSNSVTTCGVQEVQKKLDALAGSVKWANLTKVTNFFDHEVQVLVGASDLSKDLLAVAAAVESKNTDSIGDSINKLLSDWTTIEGGCTSNQTVCNFVDGLLKVIATTAKQVKPCEEALAPAVSAFSGAAQLFKAKHYDAAVAKFAAGMDVMAKATLSDACGLKKVASTIGDLSPKLANATVKIESSSEVKIIVGSADIYDELFVMVQDFDKADYTGVGVQLGLLLGKLKASGCQTPMCIVVEGLLASLQVGFTDLEACSADLDKSWTSMQSLLSSLENKQWKPALLALGDTLKDLGYSVQACGVPSIGSILQDTASKLHKDSLANDIGVAVHFLVEGADVTPDIQKIIVDSTNKQWAALGSDLGTLNAWITSTGCHSFTCKLLEGVLEGAGMVLTDLQPCEDKVREAENDFSQGATLWGQKQHKNALNFFAAGLNVLSQAVDACGLPQELKYIQQEANVLGLGNITAVGKGLSILVHGSDLSKELSEAWTDFAQQDYRGAGAAFQEAVSSIHQWTTGKLCDETNDACYVLSGMLQYLQELAYDFKKCQHDSVDMMSHFKNGVELISKRRDPKAPKGFTGNLSAIRVGLGEIGKGFEDLANGVADCHLAELAALLTSLSDKLGDSPEVKIAYEVLKILIDGVQIEHQIASALEDFAAKNWPAFGYDLIKLVKNLPHSKDVQVKRESEIVI